MSNYLLYIRLQEDLKSSFFELNIHEGARKKRDVMLIEVCQVWVEWLEGLMDRTGTPRHSKPSPCQPGVHVITSDADGRLQGSTVTDLSLKTDMDSMVLVVGDYMAPLL